MDTGSFAGVRLPGRGFDHPVPLCVYSKDRCSQMSTFNYLLLLYDVYRDIDLLLQEIFLFKYDPNIDNPSESYVTPSAFPITVWILGL